MGLLIFKIKAITTRIVTIFNQRSTKRAKHAWQSLSRSGLFRMGIYILVCLLSLVDSLYVWISIVVLLTAYRPNHAQEVSVFIHSWSYSVLVSQFEQQTEDVRVEFQTHMGCTLLAADCAIVCVPQQPLQADSHMATARTSIWLQYWSLPSPASVWLSCSQHHKCRFAKRSFNDVRLASDPTLLSCWWILIKWTVMPLWLVWCT